MTREQNKKSLGLQRGKRVIPMKTNETNTEKSKRKKRKKKKLGREDKKREETINL